MTGGRLDSNWVAVGMGGEGVFTQSGGSHAVRQGLFIARDGNSAGTYLLQDGNLCVGGGLFVGGSQGSSGGKGTLTVTGGVVTVAGGLTIWSGGTVNLSGGALLAGGADANARVDVRNAGALNVTAGIDTLGDLTGDGNDLTGELTIGAGAILTVTSLQQDSVTVEGILVLGGEEGDGVAAVPGAASTPGRPWFLDRLRTSGGSASTPEPAALMPMGLSAAAMLARRRRKRTQALGAGRACWYSAFAGATMISARRQKGRSRRWKNPSQPARAT
jgi:hypothetical protein